MADTINNPKSFGTFYTGALKTITNDIDAPSAGHTTLGSLWDKVTDAMPGKTGTYLDQITTGLVNSTNAGKGANLAQYGANFAMTEIAKTGVDVGTALRKQPVNQVSGANPGMTYLNMRHNHADYPNGSDTGFTDIAQHFKDGILQATKGLIGHHADVLQPGREHAPREGNLPNKGRPSSGPDVPPSDYLHHNKYSIMPVSPFPPRGNWKGDGTVHRMPPPRGGGTAVHMVPSSTPGEKPLPLPVISNGSILIRDNATADRDQRQIHLKKRHHLYKRHKS